MKNNNRYRYREKRLGTALQWLPLVAAGSLLIAPQVPAATETRNVTDAAVTLEVESEYLTDSAVPYNDIDVTTKRGIVILKGEADNLLAKERATRIAESVKGVRSVVNLIKVEPEADISGTRLAKNVNSAMLADPAADSYEVTATATDKGVVTLTGTVDSWQEKELSGTVAKGVHGATAVNNNISVDYKTDRPAAEIRTEVEGRLRWDTLVDDGMIEVSVNDGTVSLKGVVGSAAEKRRARTDAWVGGVKDVDASGLKVERWARDDDLRTEKYVDREDSEIRDAIEDAFLYDPRVFSFNVEAKVSDGWVTLRGIVEDLKAKKSAERVARQTVGVLGVSNRLKVRSGERLSYQEIKENVETRLKDNPYLQNEEIDVSVQFGDAYLRGSVDTSFEKAQATSAAYGAKGVKSVKNQLEVSDPTWAMTYKPYLWSYDPYPWDYYPYQPRAYSSSGYAVKADSKIKNDIQDELFWSPFVDLDEVTVTVSDGVATLTGTVDSMTEFDAATENALEGGALEVDNNLLVD